MKTRILKIITALLTVITATAVLFSCNKVPLSMQYFVDNKIQGAFTSAKHTLTLGAGTSVLKIDADSGLFITVKSFFNFEGTSAESSLLENFGIASESEELVLPVYARIIQVEGDLAVVTKYFKDASGESETGLIERIGVIRFRGESKGEIVPFTNEYSPYISQYYLIGDYIVTPGTKDFPNPANTFSTFYKPYRNTILEAFRVRCNYSYTFILNDGFLAAHTNTHAYFFKTDNIVNGYLEYSTVYRCLPEYTLEEEEEYSELIELSIFYLGNGWFSRTARIADTEALAGHNFTYERESQLGGTEYVYAHIRCDLYNIKSGVSTERGWLFVDNVANKYNADYYADYSNVFNSAVSQDENGRYEYNLPFYNPAYMVKDGYSIVYFYYRPYFDPKDESPNYDSEISFCLIDTKGSTERINDALMPLMYVGGVGIQNNDPNFPVPLLGSATYFDMNMQPHTLAQFEENKRTYTTHAYNGVGIVAREYDFVNETIYYGMRGTDGREIAPFKYLELSPFFGDYAVGAHDKSGLARYYRIDKNGNETFIDDILIAKQGVYVYIYGEMPEQAGVLGVKNFAGSVLINAEYEKLEIVESVHSKEGAMYKSYAICTNKNGVASIFRLT